MTSKTKSLNVYLGDQKEEWVRYCESIGKKPGVALREAIENQLKDFIAPKGKKVLKKSIETLQKEKKVRVEILLTESEKEAVAEISEYERCSSRRWVVDVIRARLTGEPQLSMPEIEVLGESNYLLLSIGRNLNQITRRLNEGIPEVGLEKVISKLKDEIDEHVDRVNLAIRANVERWAIK